MDFEKTPEQVSLWNAVLAFAKTDLQGDQAWQDRWRRCGRFGLLGMPFPEEFGGTAIGPVSTAIAMEALGYAINEASLPFGLGAQIWGVQMPILRFGTDDQKRRFLPALCRGEMTGAHAMSEPNSGSDALSLTSRALRDDRGYVLNGSKSFVTNAPDADVMVVFATVNPESGPLGVTAFLIDRHLPGLEVGPTLSKMGLQDAPMAPVYFSDCRVGLESRLGREGEGAYLFQEAMDWERALILAGQLGVMQRQLEQLVEYARTRRQFQQPIGNFQAVSHSIADMALRIETGRLLLYKAAAFKEAGKSAGAAAAMAKLWISESAVQSALQALQIRAGYGYVENPNAAASLHDAMGSRIFSGTSEMMRNLIVRDLGL